MTGANATTITFMAAAATAASAALCLAFIAYQQGKHHGRMQGRKSHYSDDISSNKLTATKVTATKAPSARSSDKAANVPETRLTSSIGAIKATPSDDLDMLPIYPIGTLRSIYRLCVGTPRQGMLAPHSRGVITFHEHKVSKDSILELQHFSHVFVVFVFHLNSNANVRQNTFGTNGEDNIDKKKQGERNKRQFPSKIAPPSLGGKKVGVFSTRTPHRPNPIGFSLCKLDKVVVNSRKEGGPTFSLLLSGLDIVDGTPILDIKPYVPHYDCVGYDPQRICGGMSESSNDLESSTLTTTQATPTSDEVEILPDQKGTVGDNVRVPYWVDSGLQKRRNVTFLPEAEQFLQDLVSNREAAADSSLDKLQFYGPKSPWKDSPNKALEYLRNCMHELLGVDVRSAWQTKKARKGKFQAEKSSRVKDWNGGTVTDTSGADGGDTIGSNPLCSQQIDNLLLKYSIVEPGSALMGTIDERSKGSGAEDIVVVHSISIINA